MTKTNDQLPAGDQPLPRSRAERRETYLTVPDHGTQTEGLAAALAIPTQPRQLA